MGTGDQSLGWDTDQFCTDPAKAATVMLTVLKQGGIAPGGLNFDAKVRRESTDLRDYFIAHIGGMDTYAMGLKIAARIIEDGLMAEMVKKRYASFDSELGRKLKERKTSLEDFEAHAKKEGEPVKTSGQQELYQNLFMQYCYDGRGKK